MPSLYNTDVTANYLKAAYPFSKFGTRDLTFVNVNINGIEVNPSDPNSTFAQVVRALQQVSEIYYVGTPDTSGVVFILAHDTLVNSSKPNSQTIAMAVESGVGGNNSATVTFSTGFIGNTITFVTDFI